MYVKEGQDIHDLYNTEGFEYAIQYDVDHPRPDAIAVYVKKDNHIVGMAGVSVDSEMMWQIGIIVLPEFRGKGIASGFTPAWMCTYKNTLDGKSPYKGVVDISMYI